MVSEIRDVFFKYAPCIILIPLWLIIKIKKKPEELRPVFYFLILSVLTQVLSFAFWMSGINNLPIVHVYTILEFLTLFWFYYIVFKKSIPYPVFISISACFCFFSLMDSVFMESFFTFNTVSRSIESLIFILLPVIWLLKNLTADEDPVPENRKTLNYIICGFFIYFSGSVMLFSFSNYMNRLAHTLLLNIWLMHTLLLVFLYSAITLGLLKYKTE